jgi:hypothetical protein
MGDRAGNQCVGPDTLVLISENNVVGANTVLTVLEKKITDIECLFNQVEDPPGSKKFKFVKNPNYDDHKHKIMTINSISVTPLYRYQGDETIPLYRINAIIPPEDPLAALNPADPGYTLITTQLHPIMRNHNRVTFASLLTRGDSVLLSDGIGIVRSVTPVPPEERPATVYGLALGDRSSREQGEALLNGPAAFAARNVQLGSLISTQMRNWGTFGLPIKEQIIFTGKFATGGLAIQNQLSEILSNGINLNDFV